MINYTIKRCNGIPSILCAFFNFMGKKEIWKMVLDFEGVYEVSNYGRVRSIARTWATGKNGKIINSHKGIILKHTYLRGYAFVSLHKNNKNKCRQVHRIVYEAFNGKTNLQIDHIKEGDKNNNRLDNLQALTPRQNVIKYHSSKNKKGKYIGATKIAGKEKWASQIYLHGKSRRIGTFDSPEEASLMYKKILSMIDSLPTTIDKPLSYYLNIKK